MLDTTGTTTGCLSWVHSPCEFDDKLLDFELKIQSNEGGRMRGLAGCAFWQPPDNSPLHQFTSDHVQVCIRSRFERSSQLKCTSLLTVYQPLNGQWSYCNSLRGRIYGRMFSESVVTHNSPDSFINFTAHFSLASSTRLTTSTKVKPHEHNFRPFYRFRFTALTTTITETCTNCAQKWTFIIRLNFGSEI